MRGELLALGDEYNVVCSVKQSVLCVADVAGALYEAVYAER